MEVKKKYQINIRIFLVVGVFFLIWGIVLLSDALTIRKNLKNIYDENVDISKLKEGNYVTVDNVKVLGGWHRLMNSYVPSMSVMLTFTREHNFCAINFGTDHNKYMCLEIEERLGKDIELKIDDNGYILLEDNEEVFRDSFDFKVVKMDSGHKGFVNGEKSKLRSAANGGVIEIENSKDISFYDGIALKVIDYDKEREVLIWALSILFCAVVLIIASKPWNIVEEKYEPVREFNIVYNDKTDENDVAFAAELARTLRLDVLRYEDDYRELKKNIRNNVIAVVVSGLIAYGIRYIGALYLLTIILFIKLIGSIVILIFNNDTYFTRNFMKVIGRESIKSVINDRERKIAKCDKVISDGLYNRDEIEY